MKHYGKVRKLKLNVENMSSVLLGEDINIFKKADWRLGSNAKLEIGCNAKFEYGCLILCQGAFLKIGNDFSIGKGNLIYLPEYTSVSIGDDCMFSWDVHLLCSDAHSIFDVKTGTNINSTYDISKSRKITIGNHVWVGMRCSVLYHSRIGDGSVIGAVSLVKGNIPNNCVAVGIPAKVVKTDIAWSRNNCASDITECGEVYINLTKYGQE